jgi:hypothetical protein
VWKNFNHFLTHMHPLANFVNLANRRDGGNATMIPSIHFTGNVIKSIQACTSLRAINNVSDREFHKTKIAKHM